MPSIHTKFTHFKGSKADLLKKLGKAVGPAKSYIDKKATYAGVKNRFAKMRTSDEVKEELKRSGYLSHVKLPQNIKTARLCAEGVATVMDRYPVMKKYNLVLGMRHLRPGVLASCQTDVDGKVTVSEDYFEKDKKLSQVFADCVRQKFHPEGVGEESIVVHEYGHTINGIINREMAKIDPNYFSPRYTFQGYVYFTVCGFTDSTPYGEIEKQVSGYAAKNHREFLAEALSEALCSPNPRPVALKVLKAVDEAMQKISEAKS